MPSTPAPPGFLWFPVSLGYDVLVNAHQIGVLKPDLATRSSSLLYVGNEKLFVVLPVEEVARRIEKVLNSVIVLEGGDDSECFFPGAGVP